jgi:hypothetical protein
MEGGENCLGAQVGNAMNVPDRIYPLWSCPDHPLVVDQVPFYVSFVPILDRR